MKISSRPTIMSLPAAGVCTETHTLHRLRQQGMVDKSTVRQSGTANWWAAATDWTPIPPYIFTLSVVGQTF
jgi:hypothetical protein